jgi:hypothetical protein
MIDIHLVRDGDVELIENQRLGYVPAEIGSAFHNRDRTPAPAFIRRLELRGASQCEGRNQIEAEGGLMIVVDKDYDVGRVARHPFPGGFESVEQGLSVGFPCLAKINGLPDGGDVAATDTG